ncbi:MAG: GldM family protein [Bacteroidota bacterium]
MASGKLSPRQKMINMMYLVLTALLALNVSKEVLDAFQIIRGKLNNTAVTANANANSVVVSMKETIDDEVNKEGVRKNIGLKDTLDLIQSRTSELVGLIDNHVSELEKMGRVDPETGEIERKDELELNYQYWMGGNDLANGGHGNGQANELRLKMNEYFAFLADIERRNTSPAQRSQVTPTVLEEKIPGQDGTAKPWELYNFDGPLIGNLAILEAFKSDIYEERKKLFDKLGERLGVRKFTGDKVVAINSPVSTIVPAGLPFETRLAAAISSSTIKPKYSSGSGNIEVQDDGTAILKINASGNSIPKGKTEGKQSYTASIQVPKATGGMETITVEEQFTVRKPSVEITSATVQNLYQNCANDVNIRVPALGEYYNPKVSASSANVVASQKSKEQFRIIPTAKKCVVSVSNVLNGKTTKVGDVPYNVIKPPKPTIAVGANGRQLQGSAPIRKGSKIQVRLVPDADFKASLPNDARYQVSQILVKANLSLGPPVTVNKINTAGRDATQPMNVGLGSRGNSAPKGTVFYIEIDEIIRVNFQGKKIPDKRFLKSELMASFKVE